jgi:hypothetical protein
MDSATPPPLPRSSEPPDYSEDVLEKLSEVEREVRFVKKELAALRADVARSAKEVHRLTKAQAADDDDKKRVLAWWTLAKLLGTIATVVCSRHR